MKCCNLKAQSYISASLQLVVSLFGFVWGVLIAMGDSNQSEVKRTALFVLFVVSVSYFSLIILLLVGLKLNRILLVAIFLHVAHVILAIGIIFMIYELIMGVVHQEAMGVILLQLLIECAIIGLEILLTTPIHRLHKRMHTKSSRNEESSVKDESNISTDLEGNI